MVSPPVLSGAVHEITALSIPAVALNVRGADGGVVASTTAVPDPVANCDTRELSKTPEVVTATGVSESVGTALLPSCPEELLPQHCTLLARVRAQVNEAPT